MLHAPHLPANDTPIVSEELMATIAHLIAFKFSEGGSGLETNKPRSLSAAAQILTGMPARSSQVVPKR